MLNIDKKTSEFLVTSSMVEEVRTFIDNSKTEIEDIVDLIIEKKIDKIYFVGCGSSKAVGDSGKYIFSKYSSFNSESYTGWEFVDNTPSYLNEKTAVILISHSGTTEEVVRALDISNSSNALTIGVVNQKNGNPLGEKSKFPIEYNAHAMWECHLITLYFIACTYIQRTNPNEQVAQILLDMDKLPDVLGQHIENYEEKAIELAKSASNWKGFYTIAAGPLRSLAYKEGVITNMEFMWGHGAVIESGEFKHGPLEIVEKGVPFVVMIGTDESRHTTERTLNFIKKYNGDVIIFDYKDFSKGLHSDLAPMIMFVPFEWFSFYFALVRNHNPDDRRYYNVVEY